MSNLTDYPLVVFVVSSVVLWLSSQVGARFLQKRLTLEEAVREDFGVVLAATLTLLGLIIGFTFSMAVNRYDQRKNYEEGEANAIGTEYVRADLLPEPDAKKVRALLKSYVDQRVLFYSTHHNFYTVGAADEIRRVDDRTAQLQAELWNAIKAPAAAQPTPIMALVVAGMNDVLNSQGYAQAAWWNRIPVAAWGLMLLIAVCSNLLVGYGARNPKIQGHLLLVLPLVVSVSFFLIADIDSPRGGLIHPNPQNLISLSQSLPAQ